MKTRMLSLFSVIAALLVLGMVTPVFAQVTPTAPAPNVNEIEITGIATALGSGTITVGGRVIDTTRAEFKDAITVGALVKVHYLVAANGALVAREVELANRVDDNNNNALRDGEIEIVGVVDAVTATSITLNGQVIDISTAELNDTIAVGAVVKIHLSVAADGTFVAREVELAVGDDGELEMFGTVQALTATTVTINGQVIDISLAEMKDALAVGSFVKVHFSMAADGTLVAREVELALGDDRFDDDGDRSGRGSGSGDDHSGDSGRGSVGDDGGSGSGRSGGDDDGGDDHSGSGRSGGDDDGGDDHGGSGRSGGD